MNTIFTNEPTITPEIIESHGLTAEEYQHILDRIQRPPNLTELGIFSAMWNEHCSYKSSKKWLRMLPCSGPHVLQGPGENAGVVDIGDGECVVFKMESHNHPSMIEPFQGAATGTGGILRDIFTMGARPIAVMNALRFGSPKHPRTKELVSGVVAGIGAYANAFGVPTTGGELNFHPDYNENCLVNAFAAGITKTESIFYSKPTGPGLPLIYLGAKTGRDGIGGATMASAEFDTKNQDDKTSVQVADPFKAKCLLEACLELMETGAVIALQDMGAAGLTCSCVEMGAKGDLGIELNLDFVPLREESMSAYEIMLSESQERMLLVLHPEKKEEAQAIFLKWGLDCAIIGQTTEDKILKIFYKGKKVVHLPIQDLTEQAPEYDRPFLSPKKPEPIKDTISECDPASTLLFLIGSQHLSSRRWVWEQYDTYIGGNCLQKPGGNAGVIRVGSHTKKALAFSSDCTPRYCKADPYEGAKQAVAECWRNLTATGALPLAATDNLNFGNPERSEIMGQFSEAIKGISEACLALNFPIVSGNVSLYNETNGRGIPPTPVIAGVGLIKDCSKMVSLAFQGDEENILLLGAPEIWGTHLEQSIYMQECCSYFDGPPPPVDLIHEKKIGHFVRACLEEGLFTAVHDLSDGGLAVALAEMTLASNRGALINQPEGSITKAFFGEDQGRYLVTIKPKNIEKIQEMASLKGISSSLIGTTGGETLKLGNAPAISIAALKESYESWFPTFMRF